MASPASVHSTPVPAPAQAAPGGAGEGVERALRGFRTALGVCFLGTVLVSHRAWLASGRQYPLVPVIDGLPQPPFPVDWLLLAGMVAALAGMSFARRPRPYLAAVLGIAGVWMVLDQTRWQPYLLTFLAGTACLLLGETRAVRGSGHPPARWHMAPFQLSLCATWIYSGLHKFNLRYLDSQFPWLTQPFWSRLGIPAADAPRVLFWPGIASAVLETAFGVALLWPRTRRAAVVGLTAMHGLILLVLGPLGMRYNVVVWPWNVAVVSALWLLFWPRGTSMRFDGFVRAWWTGRAAAVPAALRTAWTLVILLFCVRLANRLPLAGAG